MTEVVTSPQNPIIKLAASLKQKKRRDELNLFAAEGIRLVEEAAASDWQLETLIVTDEISKTFRVQQIITKLENKGCRIVTVPIKVYERITDTDQPQGIMLLIKKNLNSFDTALRHDRLLLAILDCVQDPGNVGTLIRTADAAGCHAVIMTKGCADLFSGKTMRASMGSVFHLPVYLELSSSEIVDFVKSQHIKLAAASLESSDIYYKADLTAPTAIVFGNEGNGVSSELLDICDLRLHIPIIGRAESLNVATAAAVILFEAVRQRSLSSCN